MYLGQDGKVMSSASFGSSKGSAFRARRFVAWSLRRLASRYGELPLHGLPGAIPVTDSAAAPTRKSSERTARQPSPPRPDPEYESRLEQLAQSMLAAAPEPDQPTHAAPGKHNANPGETSAGDGSAAAPVRQANRTATATAPAREAGSTANRESADRETGPARQTRPASGGRAANADQREPTSVRRPSRTAPPVDFGPDGRGRREPVLDPLTVSNNGRGLTPPPSRRLRNSAIVMAMLTGIAIGIGSAWWFAELDEMDRVLASAGASARASAGASTGQRSGDSGSAGATVEQAAGVASPAERLARARETADGRDAPDAPAATPKVVSPSPAAVASSADQDGVPNSGVASTASAEVSKPPVASVDARPAKEKSKAKERPQAQDSKRSASQTAAAKRSKKSAPVARALPEKSDDDIERLRSQAYSESSRDREQRMLPKPTGPATAVAVTPISTASAESRLSHKKELAQCEKLDGLLYRERCKWKICKDQWGNNGCPSFSQPAVRF
jgi:hypothetical protein